MHRICNVECEWIWTTFRARPKWLATGGGLVWRKVEQQLTNLIRELILPVQSCPFNTVFEVFWFVGDQCSLECKTELGITPTQCTQQSDDGGTYSH